jgi:hypothetical protein
MRGCGLPALLALMCEGEKGGLRKPWSYGRIDVKCKIRGELSLGKWTFLSSMCSVGSGSPRRAIQGVLHYICKSFPHWNMKVSLVFFGHLPNSMIYLQAS